MNAAARLVHQGTLTRHLVWMQILTRSQMMILSLALMVLLSALSVIYVTQVTREMRAQYEQGLVEQSRLQTERGQLLLERSTYIMQARTQEVAEKQLGMVAPSGSSLVVVKE